MVPILQRNLFKGPRPLIGVSSREDLRTPQSDHTNLVSFILHTTKMKERKVKILIQIDSLDLRNRSTLNIKLNEKSIPRE
jgi:hypothetical protein